MALAWSMDKIGPICRSVEDTALVLNAIYGPDGSDLAVKNYPFNWNASVKPSALRVGYFKAAFDLPERDDQNRLQHATKVQDDAAIDVLKKLGVSLIPVELPTAAVGTSLILSPEAGAAFETLLLSGKIKEMVQQSPGSWPNSFRSAHFIPAVDYINANRARQLVMQQWWDLFKNLDVIVAPTNSGQLGQTNLTGNPSVIIPNGFREAPPLGPPPAAPRPDSARAPGDTTRPQPAPTPAPRPLTPVSLTFLGPLYHEERALALAHAYQRATDHHLKVPPGFSG
jgi:Asp-tRNA(Asn)/Glu-tRNA(Gln) amidotransferase A subunit family amidase